MFTQTTIDHVSPPVYRGHQVFVSWAATTAGLTWQVYLNGRRVKSLVAAGTTIGVWLPVPSGGIQRCDIGSVDPAEINTDFSGSLPAAPQRRVKISWNGGVFQAPDIVGFHVYGEATPGGGIDYGTILATIAAYPGGIAIDGFGQSGFGLFGFGNDGGTYTWQSGALPGGTWNFGIKAYNAAGNEGTAVTTSATIAVPPSAPPRFSDGTRLHYATDGFGTVDTFGSGGFGLAGLTLTWNAST